VTAADQISHIPPPAFLDEPAVQAVLQALPEARLVGGCVRDAIAGAPVADIDLATPQPPEQVLAALKSAGLRGVPTGIAHGTITAVSLGRGFEVTTLRRDVRTDGRHAEVAFTDDWREDAARRDFTFNAMSLTRSGELHDYFGGRADLAAGRVRFVGNPATRLAEDRLRVLRYFRFFARYAAALPDEATRFALREAASQLYLLSAERVWAELKRILTAPDPRAAVGLMGDLGVLAQVLPEAAGLGRFERLIGAGAPPDAVLRLAALLDPSAASPAARLRFASAEAAYLDALRAGPAPRIEDDDAALRRLLAETPAPVLIGRAWLMGAPDALRERLAAIAPPMFPLRGRDALNLGLPPGAAVGEALAQVRAWWLAGGCVADRAACLAQLARLQGGR
jgi:poly(A) polymerase/tRNA nucleotidyltransferase (CCA-adding enzyme)